MEWIDEPSLQAAAIDGGDGSEVEGPYLFGDLLAIARMHWVYQMKAGVQRLGYSDYRRSDAALLRLLQRRGSVAISEIGSRLGITRQAARKLVDGLKQRGYCTEARDGVDGRVVRVRLSAAGVAYARSVITVITQLNSLLTAEVDPSDLAVADAVLRTTLLISVPAVVDRMAPRS